MLPTTAISFSDFQIPQILTRAQVVQFFPLSMRFLEGDARKLGFPELRISAKIIRYDRDEIFEWLRARRVVNDNQARKARVSAISGKAKPAKKRGRPSKLDLKFREEANLIQRAANAA